MNVRVEEEPRSRLLEHGQIPIAFLAERVLVGSVIDAGLGGITLAEAEVDQPWEKDYEAIKGEGPPRWLRRFDTSRWGLFATYRDGTRIRGAIGTALNRLPRPGGGSVGARSSWW